MRKVKSSSKIFCEPFVEPDYYKTVTYEDVFRAVREEINNNIYTWTYPAEGIRLEEDIDLTTSLKAFVPMCPDLFDSNSSDAKKLVAHFGELINTSHYGQNPEERQKAKDAIEEILNNKIPYAKWSKVYIPPLLSLNDMCAYVHKITKYLKSQYLAIYERETLNKDDIRDPDTLEELRRVDKRLVEIATKGYVEMLIGKPKELTKKLVADFFGLKSAGVMGQLLKEEKRHPNTCHLEW